MGATIDRDALKHSLFSMDEERRDEILKEFSDRYGQLFMKLNEELAGMLKRGEYLLLHCSIEALELSMTTALENWAKQNAGKRLDS